jgi:hypothetical protein
MDNAVSIKAVETTTTVIGADGIVTTTTSTAWPPILGSTWTNGVPLQIPAYNPPQQGHGDAVSWDLAFEISTNEPSYEDDPMPGDIDKDGDIDLADLSILAANYPWNLSVVP